MEVVNHPAGKFATLICQLGPFKCLESGALFTPSHDRHRLTDIAFTTSGLLNCVVNDRVTDERWSCERQLSDHDRLILLDYRLIGCEIARLWGEKNPTAQIAVETVTCGSHEYTITNMTRCFAHEIAPLSQRTSSLGWVGDSWKASVCWGSKSIIFSGSIYVPATFVVEVLNLCSEPNYMRLLELNEWRESVPQSLAMRNFFKRLESCNAPTIRRGNQLFWNYGIYNLVVGNDILPGSVDDLIATFAHVRYDLHISFERVCVPLPMFQRTIDMVRRVLAANQAWGNPVSVSAPLWLKPVLEPVCTGCQMQWL